MKKTSEMKIQLPVIGEEQLDLLEKLSNACSVSGDEGEVRGIVLELVRPLADEVKIDALGNVIAFKKGNGENLLKVMLDAHMDEIGFMVTADDGDGLFQFEPVGGIDVRQLPGKPVLIGKNKVPAVIGARAIHLTTSEQRKSAIPLNTLRFDIGPTKANSKVKPGDRAAFATRFRKTEENLFGKALDDRLGIVILIEILKNSPENLDMYYVFSTQEEVGLRGALTAAYQIHPDIGIAVDSTPARDFPSTDEAENTKYNTKFGGGPAIYTMDSASIADPRLVRYFIRVADENEIRYQFRQPGPGGTDAGAIHKQHSGIPSISISVPGRYAHTAIGLASKDDFEKTLQLVYLGLMNLDKDLLQVPRK